MSLWARSIVNPGSISFFSTFDRKLTWNCPLLAVVPAFTSLNVFKSKLIFWASVRASAVIWAILNIWKLLTTFALISAPLLALSGLFGEQGSEEDGLAKIEAKLDTLISVVEAGGDVILDGSKVGETLQLGSSKLA